MKILALVLATLVCGSVTLARSQSGPVQTCSTGHATSASLTLNSYRNGLGKWESQVGLTHEGGPPRESGSEPWSVTVQHNVTETCQRGEEITILATLTSADGTQYAAAQMIPAGYELFPSVGNYKLHPTGATWADARKICADEGTHLVIINSENEANVMKQFFSRYPKEKLTNTQVYDGIWVGIYEQAANGNYFTIFGEAMNATGFGRWHPGHPNLPGSDECVIVYRTTGGLWDFPCAQTVPFVCETWN